MAWPLSALTTYIAGNIPRVKAVDLNQIQDAIVKIIGAGYTIKQLILDGTGGTPYTPASGDDIPSIKTTEIGATGVAKRKLIWQMKIGSTPMWARLYGGNAGVSSALEIVINAAWDPVGQQWTADTTSGKVLEIVLGANVTGFIRWRYYDTSGGATFTDSAWVSTTIDPRDGVAIDKEGVTAAGTLTTSIAGWLIAATPGDFVYGHCSFRKAFPSTPSTFSVVGNLLVPVNLTAGVLTVDSLSKWGFLAHKFATGAGPAAFDIQITVS